MLMCLVICVPCPIYISCVVFNAFFFPGSLQILIDGYCSSTFSMADIEPPVNAFEAVVHLPDTQHPYGASCQLNRAIQCVFFHYRLRQAEADLFVQEGFTDIVLLSEADPDGSAEQRQLYTDCLEAQIVGLLWRRLTSKAVRRLLSGKAFVDIAVDVPPPPPAKKVKTSAGGSASASAPSTSSSSSSSSSSGVAKKIASAPEAEASDVDEDGDDDFSDHDSDGAGLDDDPKGDGKVSSKESLSALFADCSTEVCFVGALSCAAYLIVAMPGMQLACFNVAPLFAEDSDSQDRAVGEVPHQYEARHR